ncbi:MAG: hypothetical protein RIC15_11190 [Vicingaceae bacterium]
MRYSVVIVFLFLLASSCNKQEENEAFAPVSPIPQIELLKVEPLELSQFEDLVFHIRYSDGNGDIGTADPDDHSLEITDKRANVLHTYHVPPQYVVKNVAITGVMQISLENVVLIDQDNDQEQAVFSIRLRDNKSNWSQRVNSPTITINK